MNAPDSSFFPHISRKNVDYNAVNSFMAKNFFLDKIRYNHHSAAAMRYILSCILEKHFGIELKAQKHIKEGRLLAKYFNWAMLLKNIQCTMQKADIIPLLILPFNETSIAETVNILRWLTKCFGLTNIVKDKIVPIKWDFLTVRNIICVIY